MTAPQAICQIRVQRRRVRRPAMRVAPLLIGLPLHALLIAAPVVVVGGLSTVAGPAAVLFLLLGSVWVFFEAVAQRNSLARVSFHPHDRLARRLAAANGWLLLVLGWLALLTSRSPSLFFMLAGASFMLAGIALRAVAIARLGRHFRTEIVVASGQPLVRDGVFAWVRHPSESGLLLLALGTGVLLASLPALIFVAAAVLPLTLWRIELEERRLREGFAARYAEYAAGVRRLVPLVY